MRKKVLVSGASGFACWFLVLPLLLLPDGRIRWRDRRGGWQVWLLGCVATTFLYFRGYETPAHHPSLMGALSNPLSAFQYFCAYLGGPFAHGTAFNAATVAQPVGAVLLLAVMAAAVYLWRWRRDAKFLSQTLPWLMLTLFALLNAALTALGRQSFGVNQALNSRYLAFSVLLPIGLVFLAPLIFNHWRTQAVPAQKTVTVGMVLSSLGAVLVLLHGLGSLRNLETWKGAQHHRLRTKALVQLINVVDDPEALGRYVHAIVPPLKDRANLLNRLGYLRPGLVQTNLVRLIAGANPLAPARYGEIQQAGKPAEGQFGLAGWSVLPDKARPADAVLLTYDNAAGDSVIFALAEVGVQRPDVAAWLQEPGYLHAGWVKTFNTSRLPAGALSLRAWAFDAETCRAYPIQGVAPSQR